MNAKQAVERSISHTEIVTLDHDAQVIEDLLSMVDNEGDIDGNECHEFWGTTDGSEWRVHVRHV